MRRAIAALLGAGLLVPAGVAVADSFTPVTLTISVTPIARRAAALPLRIAVHADAGVLDSSGEGPMRLEVKLAPECGGDFQHTPGTTLMNLALTPPPATGRAYTATMSSRGRPLAYGVQTVCAFVETSTTGRVYAHDDATTVNVTPACTTAGMRYDRAARQVRLAQRALRRASSAAARRRARRVLAGRRRTLAAARRSGTAACGRGVAL